MPQSSHSNKFVEIACAAETIAGELVSGDAYVVLENSSGVLIAVIDGLGHGEDAFAAATRTTELLHVHVEESLENIFRYCHIGLKKTNGVVMTLAHIDPRKAILSWCGVGNVEAVLLRKEETGRTQKEYLLLKNGMVGKHPFTCPRVLTLPIKTNDRLLFFTDGIRNPLLDKIEFNVTTQNSAHSILNHFQTSTDDALVLVVKFIYG
jgi:phosphoserine phosphatase RsbX